MIYHKKPLNNFYKNNNMNKSKKDINELINEKIDNICKNIKDSNNIINFNNKDYLIKLQQNEKMNEFKDFTLSEYLKEQIQNMEPNKLLDNTKNTNSHNYNSHEETNVNTLGTFTGKSKEKQLKCSKKNLKKNNSIKHMINHNLNNYITYNNYINSSLNYSTNNCKDKNKKKDNNYINASDYTIKKDKINKKEQNKKLNEIKYMKKENTKINIKRKKSGNCRQDFFMKDFLYSYNNNQKIPFKRKSMNSPEKNFSISIKENKINKSPINAKKFFNSDKRNRIMNDKKKYNSYEKYISNINITSNCIHNISKKKNRTSKYNNISSSKKREKCLFNVQIDISKLLNENSFHINNPKKTFRFSKSPKKIINNNININNFNKDFLIIPKLKK
jgi:hypothetical protein